MKEQLGVGQFVERELVDAGGREPALLGIDAADADCALLDAHSVDVLRKYGIQRVLVLKVGATGTPYEQALTRPLDGLPLTRTESADLVTFTVRSM